MRKQKRVIGCILGLLLVMYLWFKQIEFQGALEVGDDDVAFPVFLKISNSEHILGPSVISGWNQIRNTDAKLKQFENVSVWRSMYMTYFRNTHVFSVSHRCNKAGNFGNDAYYDKPWFFSWLLPTIHTTNIDVAYLDASQYYGDAFYHMVHEKFFALGIIREMLETYPNMIILVDVFPPKLAEFVQLLGLDSSRFHVISTLLNVKTLYVPYSFVCTAMSSQHVLETRKWIRDRHPYLYVDTATDIVLIDRMENGVCKRCLPNSQQLFDKLKQRFANRKIHHVIMGELTTYQVLRLLSQTNVLIAPHGAGLVHMIFLPDNAKVIEIMNHPEYINVLFNELSVVLGLDYVALTNEEFVLKNIITHTK